METVRVFLVVVRVTIALVKHDFIFGAGSGWVKT